MVLGGSPRSWLLACVDLTLNPSRAPAIRAAGYDGGTMTPDFRRGRFTIIGGFHTSGTINMLGEQEPDIQELFREGICVVSGEVEGKWDGILSDFLHGQLKPLYSYAQDLQNLVP